MSEPSQQNFANHRRIDPLYHFLIAPLLLFCFLGAVHLALKQPRGEHIWLAALSGGVFLLAVKARLYALKLQDRVIRLEERVRLAALLAEPLKSRIPELTEAQLIALRFASDGELPALVGKTLSENLGPKAIKQFIRQWRGDYSRV